MIALTSCTGTPDFPAEHIYEVDHEFGVCGKYKIVEDPLDISHVKDLPLEECRGVFGFQAEDVGHVLDWTRSRIDEAKEKCE